MEFSLTLALYPTAGLLAASQALASVYASHAQDKPVEAPLYAFNDFHAMIGFGQVWDFEKKYVNLLSERQ
jgi:hypothetical protein